MARRTTLLPLAVLGAAVWAVREISVAGSMGRRGSAIDVVDPPLLEP